MAKRLRAVCALPESKPLWRAGRGFVVRSRPECARPRAQQRGFANHHRIDWSTQPLVYCSGRDGRTPPSSPLAAIPNQVVAARQPWAEC